MTATITDFDTLREIAAELQEKLDEARDLMEALFRHDPDGTRYMDAYAHAELAPSNYVGRNFLRQIVDEYAAELDEREDEATRPDGAVA